MNRLSPPALVLLVLGLEWSAMAATLPNESFTFQCPTYLALTNISSVYDNATQDRTWEFGCQSINWRLFYRCLVYPPANNWNTDVSVQCNQHQDFFAGMASIYDNDAKDRIFLFVCCRSPGGYYSNCSWTNDLNEYGGPMNFFLPTGKIALGVKGRYSSSARDRIWRFHVCDLVSRG